MAEVRRFSCLLFVLPSPSPSFPSFSQPFVLFILSPAPTLRYPLKILLCYFPAPDTHAWPGKGRLAEPCLLFPYHILTGRVSSLSPSSPGSSNSEKSKVRIKVILSSPLPFLHMGQYIPVSLQYLLTVGFDSFHDALEHSCGQGTLSKTLGSGCGSSFLQFLDLGSAQRRIRTPKLSPAAQWIQG